MSRARRLLTPIVVAALAPAWIGCSSSTTDPVASKALTSREAQTVASALFTQIFGALGTTVGFARNGTAASGGLVFDRTATPAGVHAVYGTTTTSTFSAPCPLGGTVAGGFTDIDNVDANGTGTISVSGTYTPAACVVSTGTRNVTVTGAPSLTMSVSVPLVRYVQSGVATFQMGGGFAYDGGTCQVNYTVSFNATGHGSISGSVCGQDVSQTI